VIATAPAPPVEKKGALVRRPPAVPVIATTIVISKKKPIKKAEAKPEKKKSGGPIRPRKPDAVPPKHGPGNGDVPPPSPFRKGGRVQVPRGSGAAIRGKHFSGIF
jgi:hypothetical protein